MSNKAYFEKMGMAAGHEFRQQQMAKDKAERENEFEDDYLQYERAGLSPAEQAKVPKLDINNNLSYRYLRACGNNWEYDPHAMTSKMKARCYKRFDTFDKDCDGNLTLDEVMTWADRMKTLCKAGDIEIETVRAALKVFFENRGCTGDGVCRENWIESHQALAEADRERARRGEKRMVNMLGDAYYDVLDTDKDGLVSLPELKRMFNIFRVPEEAAYTFFEHADTNKNGTLERAEMHRLFIRFWMTDVEDAAIDGIFAYKY